MTGGSSELAAVTQRTEGTWSSEGGLLRKMNDTNSTSATVKKACFMLKRYRCHFKKSISKKLKKKRIQSKVVKIYSTNSNDNIQNK